MNADQQQHNEPKKPSPEEKVSTNPELGITRVRTFADDLKAAKEKAGVTETEDTKKKSAKAGLFRRRKKKKDVLIEKKTLSKKIQPEVTPKEVLPEEIEQPSKEFIEQELARSGIVAEAPQEEEPEEKKESSVPAIRTYKYDAAESVEDRNLSQVKIAAAEQNRRAKEGDFSSLVKSKNGGSSFKKNAIYILASIVLVVSGLWGGIHFYNQSRIVADPAIQTNQGVLLFTNSEVSVSIDDKKGSDFLATLEEERAKPFPDGSAIKEIRLIENTLFGERFVTGNSFLERLQTVPGRLSRSVTGDFLFGIHGGERPAPILVFKTNDFDTTFAGMLEWESTMSADFSPLFGALTSGMFEDVIVRNKDTRVLENALGGVTIIYGFPNTETLVITTNENTFFEVFERLIASNATRN